MATIQKRTGKKKGTTYRVMWREPDGSQRSRSFGSMADARRWRTKVEHDMDAGEYVTRADARTPLRDVAERWRTEGVFHRPTTAYAVESRLRNQIYPTFGDRPIGSITRGEVQAWVRRLSDSGLAPNTVRGCYRQLSTVFRSAVEDRVVVVSPCLNIDLPKVDRVEVEAPALADVAAVWEAIDDRYRAILNVAAGTGMRIGEILGLTVDRVDFLRREIRVDRQGQNVGTGPFVLVPYTKSDSGVRRIPVGQDVIDAIAAHIAEFGTGPEGVIFTSSRGGGIRRPEWLEAWKRARAKAGIDLRGVHQLRHLYASALIRQNVDPNEIKRHLGHRSITETFDTYGHMWPNDEDRIRDAVGAAYGPGFLRAAK